MNKKQILIFLISMTGVLAVVVVLMIMRNAFRTGIDSSSSSEEDATVYEEYTESEKELGNINEELFDNEELDFHGNGDDEVDYPLCSATKNPEYIYDILPFGAIANLDYAISDWLNKNGHATDDIIVFTINPTSISPDITYPYFEMSSEDESLTLSVRYMVETKEFVIEKI